MIKLIKKWILSLFLYVSRETYKKNKHFNVSRETLLITFDLNLLIFNLINNFLNL
jgi:hypothetical protein